MYVEKKIETKTTWNGCDNIDKAYQKVLFNYCNNSVDVLKHSSKVIEILQEYEINKWELKHNVGTCNKYSGIDVWDIAEKLNEVIEVLAKNKKG